MNFTLTLAVSDLERTAIFYGEILELAIERFVPVPGHPAVLLLGHGEATVLFRETAALEALHPALFQDLERHPRGVGVTLEFAVRELKPILKNIARRGLHTLYELEDDEFGRHEVWLHDPDGYLVIFSEEPEEGDA
jgi:catechol 2,3-dioxygenase-like lactoylglutathione lyase family enzyme